MLLLRAMVRLGCVEVSCSEWDNCDLWIGMLALPEKSPHLFDPQFPLQSHLCEVGMFSHIEFHVKVSGVSSTLHILVPKSSFVSLLPDCHDWTAFFCHVLPCCLSASEPADLWMNPWDRINLYSFKLEVINIFPQQWKVTYKDFGTKELESLLSLSWAYSLNAFGATLWEEFGKVR